MNRKVVVFVGFALAGALLLPTAAAPNDTTDQIHEDVVLSPSEGPNSAYALVNEDDEIELNFGPSNPNVEGDGVSAGTITPFDRVFTITYTGEQSAAVYLTDGTEAVTFYEGTDPGASIEGEDDAVELGPDETVAVGVLIDTRDGAVETVDDFTVHADVTEPGDVTTGTTATGADIAIAGTGDDADTPTPTPTPESPETEPTTPTATPAETPSAATVGETAGSPTRNGAVPGTAATATGPGAPAADTPDAGGAGPTEFGGLDRTTLAALVGALTALVLSLAAFRQFRG